MEGVDEIVYDERQHLDLFHGPGQYLFRGTLPSTAFAMAYQGVGVTPTSVDPVVATLFACRYRMDGPACVLLALKSDLRNDLDGPNLQSFSYELAVNIELPPDEFERRCRRSVSVEVSVSILNELGYPVPARLPDLGALAQALARSSRMRIEDIDRYVERCYHLPEG